MGPGEIRHSCPGADTDFIVQAIESGWTMEQCQRNAAHYIARQKEELTTKLALANEQIESFGVELGKLKKENASLMVDNEALHARIDQMESEREAERDKAMDSKGGIGVKPLPVKPAANAVSYCTARESFWNAVQEQEAKGKTRQEAISAVNRREPELREAMLEEANSR